MANPLQQLLSLVQGGQPMGAGMAATGPSDMVSETPDIVSQLKALMGGGGQPPMMPQTPMPGPAVGPQYAGADAVNPMARAIQNYTGPRQQMPGGYADDALDVPEGTAPNDPASGRMPGQRNMGAYLNANKPMPGDEQDDEGGYSDRTPPSEGPGNPKYDQTKSELDDISKRMGSGDPSEDGNFPTQAEIDALNAGKISPAEFDRKWGKGAAAEMQDVGKGNEENDGDEDDPGDHEYR